jgi:type IV secretory pathway VirB4 component
MKLFRNESYDPKTNAQRNLMGRTHYVDDETLRFHASRIISARHTDDGLLFALVTSDAKNYEKTQRGFRYVIFDVFGTVIERNPANLEMEWFSTSKRATQAMWAALNSLDARQITREGIKRARRNFDQELEKLEEVVSAEGGAA